MPGQFEGKVAIVTGGNSGIGKATAIQFAQEGAKVTIAARRVEEGQQVAQEIRGSGGDAIFVQTDVSIESDVEAMVAKTVETYGRLDCAFNNAGTGGGPLLHEFTEEEFDRIMDVNVKGTWLCMKHEIIQMLKQGQGAFGEYEACRKLLGLG